MAILLGLIKFYKRALSPFLPRACRFFPSCSEYAYIALRTHGLRSGSWLALRRLLRCHPWGGSGVDLVPGTSCVTLNEKDE